MTITQRPHVTLALLDLDDCLYECTAMQHQGATADLRRLLAAAAAVAGAALEMRAVPHAPTCSRSARLAAPLLCSGGEHSPLHGRAAGHPRGRGGRVVRRPLLEVSGGRLPSPACAALRRLPLLRCRRCRRCARLAGEGGASAAAPPSAASLAPRRCAQPPARLPACLSPPPPPPPPPCSYGTTLAGLVASGHTVDYDDWHAQVGWHWWLLAAAAAGTEGVWEREPARAAPAAPPRELAPAGPPARASCLLALPACASPPAGARQPGL